MGEGVREERRVDEVNRWVSYRGRRLLSLEMMDRWNSSSSSFVRAALMLYILYIHTPVQSRPTPESEVDSVEPSTARLRGGLVGHGQKPDHFGYFQ